MWNRILALVIKEFLTLLRDPRERALIVIPPLIQLIVFSYAATFDLNHVKLAVYDQDGGHAAQMLIARFSGSPNFQIVARPHNHAALARLVDSEQALMVLNIGADFSRKLLSGRPADVQLIIDGRNSNTALIALNYARGIVDTFNRDWLRTHAHAQMPLRLVTRAWFNPNLESRWFIVPGIVGLLMMVVVMMVTALSVAREREQGTFDQLLVTPLRPIEILIGKALPGLLIGLFEATLIVIVAIVWFGVPLRGHLLTLYTGLFLFLLSASGVGLMISSLATTLQQALLGAFMFLVPGVILSGFATPIANMPLAVQYITLLDPLRYFMAVLRGVFLEGASFSLLWNQFWPMALIGVGCLAGAGWLFRHRST
ncbi:antibiotic ABC transporter permease [Acidihalobacter yilgarnensis]|uniref:Antibiotic ABC transporter permease n=1 Tax=Acidihalobacter yilgarnensis TaxID=2819280 RepID=A0A1D8IML6_9GAMM|nr:ABC transporter permease [Acidihalobacter yilgarnensis]AOU97665.1 antibiotic ABC transporter permease [Acidihalobacter yilgarnensis]